jgi:1-acyl-sn-glycerol-3-phosphate acyltransferase
VQPWYRVAVVIVKPLVLLLFRRRFEGQDRLPRSGGMIVAPNHIGYADPFVLALFLHDAGRRPRFLGKSSIWRIPLVGRILTGAGQIPVYRESTDAVSALRAAIAAVERGECVVVYPEGTVTRDPDLWPMTGKTGVARLALETGAPVIPVAMWGPQDFLRYPSLRPRLWPRALVRIRAGDAVDLSRFSGRPADATVLREMTTAVMRAVAAELGALRGETPPAELYDRTRTGDERRSA